MKNSILILCSVFFFFSYNGNVQAQCCDNAETETCCSKNTCGSLHQHGVAPIGVMNDHCHPKGGLMLSYRFMNMSMKDNLSGKEEISSDFVFTDYMLAPQEMDMQMHMVGLMYGFSDRITLMGMINYQQNEMSMTTMDGKTHNHVSSGIGDFSIKAIANIWKSKNQSVHVDFGMSLPTGNIALTEVNHMVHAAGGDYKAVVMPYPMRLGSGTYDVLLGATYTVVNNKITLGLQTNNILRTQNNDRGYHLGNQYKLNIWGAYQVNKWAALSIRGEGRHLDKIKGVDDGLMPVMSPSNNVLNSGGEQIMTYLGLNFSIPKLLNGFQVGAEFGLPVYQKVNGTQMNQQSLLTLGIKGNIL